MSDYIKFKEWVSTKDGPKKDQEKCQNCGRPIRRNEPHKLCNKCRVALYTSSMNKK